MTKYPREWPGEDDHDDEAPPHDRLIAAPTSRQARLEMREAPSVPEVPHQEVGEYAVAAPDCTRRWIRAPMIRTHVDAETRAAYDIQEDYYEAVHLPAEPGFASTYQPEQGYVSWSDWWEVPTIPDICKDLLRPTE